MTNLFILCVSLLTNTQSAVIGQTNGHALLAAQETIVQRTVRVEDVLLSSRATTNAVPIAMAAPVVSPAIPLQIAQTNAPRPGLNTNSPALRHRLEREQRMRGTNGIPAK